MSSGVLTTTWESMDKDKLRDVLSKKTLLKSCVDALYKNDIDGEVLLLLSESDMENIGLTFGQRKLIMKLISSPASNLECSTACSVQTSPNWTKTGAHICGTPESDIDEDSIPEPVQKNNVLSKSPRVPFTLSYPDKAQQVMEADNFHTITKMGTEPGCVDADEDDLSARIWCPEDPILRDDDDWLIICNLEYPGISNNSLLEVLLRDSGYEVDPHSISHAYCRAYFRGRGPITLKGYDQIRTFSHKLRAFKHNYVVNVPSRAFTEPIPRWPRKLLFLVEHDSRLTTPDPIIEHMQNGGHSSKCIAAMIRLASNKTVVALYKTPKYFRRLPLVNGHRVIRKISLPTNEEMKSFRDLFKQCKQTPPPENEHKQEVAAVSPWTNNRLSPCGSPIMAKIDKPVVDKPAVVNPVNDIQGKDSLLHVAWPPDAGEGGLALNPKNMARTMQAFTPPEGIMKMDRPAYQPSLSPIPGSCASDSADSCHSSKSPTSNPLSEISSQSSRRVESQNRCKNFDNPSHILTDRSKSRSFHNHSHIAADRLKRRNFDNPSLIATNRLKSRHFGNPSHIAKDRLKSSNVYFQAAQEALLEQEEKSLESDEDSESTPTHATLSQKFVLNWFSLS